MIINFRYFRLKIPLYDKNKCFSSKIQKSIPIKADYEKVDQNYVGKYKNEHEKWEADHYKSTNFEFGAKDKKEKLKAKDKDYDLIVDDDMIDFVQAFTIAGENRKDEGPKLSEKEKKRQSIKEVRESLPIYHYREGLLDAIEEHQGKFI